MCRCGRPEPLGTNSFCDNFSYGSFNDRRQPSIDEIDFGLVRVDANDFMPVFGKATG